MSTVVSQAAGSMCTHGKTRIWHGFTVANGRLLVEQHTGAWPARSPDLSWLDEFVWGWMVREMHFEDVTTKVELRAAVSSVWSRLSVDKKPLPHRCGVTHSGVWPVTP